MIGNSNRSGTLGANELISSPLSILCQVLLLPAIMFATVAVTIGFALMAMVNCHRRDLLRFLPSLIDVENESQTPFEN